LYWPEKSARDQGWDEALRARDIWASRFTTNDLILLSLYFRLPSTLSFLLGTAKVFRLAGSIRWHAVRTTKLVGCERSANLRAVE